MNFKLKITSFVGLIFFLISTQPVKSQELLKFMQSQPEIVQIKAITGNDFFTQTYDIRVRQPLNHQDTTEGFFLQRVFVADKNVNRPVVLITEGYDANYAANPKYINELSTLLEANQICVEHRYFGESVPTPLNWQYLTVKNAAEDHHHIVEIFKKYYSLRWLNTGISKGGQTALAHRTFFPDDVSATVAYVAPLNFGIEDGRHEKFLQQVGSNDCREKITTFQRQVLKRRKEIIPLLENYAEEKSYTFPMPLNEVLDLVVLEYSFSFWQWGNSCNEIPTDSTTSETLFNYLVKISPPDYFSYEGSIAYKAFFYQAARELGYYGYDTTPFTDLLSIKSAKNYVNRFMLPQGCSTNYNPETSLMVYKYLHSKAKNVILIYGEVDPWSASAASIRKRRGNQKVVLTGGNHKTRIGSFPEKTREKLVKSINKMLQ